MRTLANELTAALTAPKVLAAQREVKRTELPVARQFERAVRVATPGSLDRMRYLCEVAMAKPTEAKIYNAKQALMEAIGKHANRGFTGKYLTRQEWELLGERYYGLCLPGQTGWATAGEVYDTCVAIWAKESSAYAID